MPTGKKVSSWSEFVARAHLELRLKNMKYRADVLGEVHILRAIAEKDLRALRNALNDFLSSSFPHGATERMQRAYRRLKLDALATLEETVA